MDVVPPAGAVCARLGSEAKIADAATMPAVTANPRHCPVKLDFDRMLDSSLSDTRLHSVGLADELSPTDTRRSGRSSWLILMSPYSSQLMRVNRANGRPAGSAPLMDLLAFRLAQA